ncbi:MAG: O-antigen ligase family protein [Acidimicrobiales bacterium]
MLLAVSALWLMDLGVVADLGLLVVVFPLCLRYLISVPITHTDAVQRFTLVLLGLYVLVTLWSPSATGLKRTVGIMAAFAIYSYFRDRASVLRSSRALLWASLLLAITTIGLVVSPLPLPKNTAGGIVAYQILTFTYVLSCRRGKTRSRILTLGWVSLCLAAIMLDHRTLAALACLAVLVTATLAHVRRRGLLVRAVWSGSLAAAIAVVAVVALPQGSDVLERIDESATEATGRTLNSGRQEIWPIVIGQIGERPILGWGTAAEASDFTGLPLSAHNLFLQVGLQVGLAGVAVLLMLFWGIWRVASRVFDPVSRPYAQGLTVFVFFHSLSEVFLFQNSLGIGLSFWALLGLVLGPSPESFASTGYEEQ